MRRENNVGDASRGQEHAIGSLEKFLYTRKEAAYAYSLGLSVRSIDYFISKGELRFRKVGTRILIPRDALRQFAREHHFGTVAPKKSV